MSLFLDAPQAEAFRSVMDYFTGRHFRILDSNSPSYIQAEIGSWTSVSFGNSKGKVEANLVNRNGGTYVNLDFSFLKEYLAGIAAFVIGAVLIYATMLWAGNSATVGLTPSAKSEYLLLANYIVLGLMVIYLVITFGIIGYSARKTRRIFLEEFNMFTQSLASKKS